MLLSGGVGTSNKNRMKKQEISLHRSPDGQLFADTWGTKITRSPWHNLTTKYLQGSSRRTTWCRSTTGWVSEWSIGELERRWQIWGRWVSEHDAPPFDMFDMWQTWGCEHREPAKPVKHDASFDIFPWSRWRWVLQIVESLRWSPLLLAVSTFLNEDRAVFCQRSILLGLARGSFKQTCTCWCHEMSVCQ